MPLHGVTRVANAVNCGNAKARRLAMPIRNQAGRKGEVHVGRKAQRLPSEDTPPISSARAPRVSFLRDHEIVRYSSESRSVGIKSPTGGMY